MRHEEKMVGDAIISVAVIILLSSTSMKRVFTLFFLFQVLCTVTFDSIESSVKSDLISTAVRYVCLLGVFFVSGEDVNVFIEVLILYINSTGTHL